MEANDTVIKELLFQAEQTDIAFKEGIREVVEWINKKKKLYPVLYSENPNQLFLGEEWQAKLKEWGID